MSRIVIDGEPSIVTDIREQILEEFKDLTFKEEGHIYTLHGKRLPSITTVVQRFEHESDWDLIAERYAIKNGQTKEYWQDKWKFNNLRATTTGTYVHEFAESLGWVRNGHPELITDSCKKKYIPEKNWLIPTRPKDEAVISFYDSLPSNMHLVLPETKVYSNKGEASMVNEQLCGTFDLLMWHEDEKDKDNSGLWVLDWKTNSSLTSSYNREKGKMMLPPFEDMYEEHLSLYTLQLSLYAMCLRGIGLDVKGLCLLWLKDDGTYEKVPVTDFSKEKWFREAF